MTQLELHEVDLPTGRPGQVPNLPEDWAISLDVVHTPLVGIRDCTAAQKARERCLTTGATNAGTWYLVGWCTACGAADEHALVTYH